MPKRAPTLPAASTKLEVHAHAVISGPRSKAGYRFDPATRETTWHGRTDIEHSHADGNAGHSHPDTGPASFTIDKDDWYRATGFRGGGRKRFTKKPTGEQLTYVARTLEQQTFTVVFCDEGYTDEYARSTGETREQWERHRDASKAAAEGTLPEDASDEPGEGGAAVARMALTFGMHVRYEYHGPRQPSGGAAAST
jgi:hypothetical protein